MPVSTVSAKVPPAHCTTYGKPSSPKWSSLSAGSHRDEQQRSRPQTVAVSIPSPRSLCIPTEEEATDEVEAETTLALFFLIYCGGRKSQQQCTHHTLDSLHLLAGPACTSRAILHSSTTSCPQFWYHTDNHQLPSRASGT